ncbi:hypothetical protein ACU4GD_04725 [Cupriavidus basilensis]
MDAEHGFRVAAGLAAAKEGVDGAVKLGAGGMRRPWDPRSIGSNARIFLLRFLRYFLSLFSSIVNSHGMS